MIFVDYKEVEDYLEVIYDGIIEVEDILEHGNNLNHDASLPSNLKILTDARTAIYNFRPVEIKRIEKALVENIKCFDSIKNAFVYNTPRETAYSQILEYERRMNNYRHRIFSTRKEALHWLLHKH